MAACTPQGVQSRRTASLSACAQVVPAASASSAPASTLHGFVIISPSVENRLQPRPDPAPEQCARVELRGALGTRRSGGEVALEVGAELSHHAADELLDQAAARELGERALQAVVDADRDARCAAAGGEQLVADVAARAGRREAVLTGAADHATLARLVALESGGAGKGSAHRAEF